MRRFFGDLAGIREFEMRIPTKEIKPGCVMASGEVVLAATASKCGHWLTVTLKNLRTKKERRADWNFRGDVFVRSKGEE